MNHKPVACIAPLGLQHIYIGRAARLLTQDWGDRFRGVANVFRHPFALGLVPLIHNGSSEIGTVLGEIV